MSLENSNQIPEGEYIVKVVSFFKRKSNQGGHPLFYWALETIEPLSQIPLFKNSMVNTDKGIAFLVGELKRFGFYPTTVDEIERLSKEIEGKTLKVKLTHQPYQSIFVLHEVVQVDGEWQKVSYEPLNFKVIQRGGYLMKVVTEPMK